MIWCNECVVELTLCAHGLYEQGDHIQQADTPTGNNTGNPTGVNTGNPTGRCHRSN